MSSVAHTRQVRRKKLSLIHHTTMFLTCAGFDSGTNENRIREFARLWNLEVFNSIIGSAFTVRVWCLGDRWSRNSSTTIKYANATLHSNPSNPLFYLSFLLTWLNFLSSFKYFLFELFVHNVDTRSGLGCFATQHSKSIVLLHCWSI